VRRVYRTHTLRSDALAEWGSRGAGGELGNGKGSEGGGVPEGATEGAVGYGLRHRIHEAGADHPSIREVHHR